MIYKIFFPQVSETNNEGIINSWNHDEGQAIKKGDVLLTIESNKTTLEIETPEVGYLRKILADEGSKCQTGDIIAIISDTMDEEIPAVENLSENLSKKIGNFDSDQKKRQLQLLASQRKSKSSDHAAPIISPYAKKLIIEYNLDVKGIHGSGPRGRITKVDILPLIEIAIANSKNATVKDTIALSITQKRISELVTKNKQSIPHAYVQTELDMSRSLDWKDKWLQQNDKKFLSISITDILIKATAIALKEFPLLNASFFENTIKIWDEINVGFVVSLGEEGLMVPVIINADKKPLIEICKTKTKLLKKITDRQISPQELNRGTFTISNLGMEGADVIIPIIYERQTAILGFGKIIKKPVYRDDKLTSSLLMWATLCFDHRVVYGETAARFLTHMNTILNNPKIWFE